ncbi:hypothetical protein [Pasteuria penetrans]|uniref:hypothetical protein n=1 Tax=Pasteuria penetrans TaxID=86005 RepID=UPI000FACD895|nr:hypothetical protein [Pasteuria penetrans]
MRRREDDHARFRGSLFEVLNLPCIGVQRSYRLLDDHLVHSLFYGGFLYIPQRLYRRIIDCNC